MLSPLYNQPQPPQSGSPVETINQGIYTAAKYGTMGIATAGVLGNLYRANRTFLEENMFKPWSQGENKILKLIGEGALKIPTTGKKLFARQLGHNLLGLVTDHVAYNQGLISSFVAKRIESSSLKALSESKIGLNLLGEKVGLGYIAPSLWAAFGLINIDEAVNQSGKSFGAYIGAGEYLGGAIGARVGAIAGSLVGNLVAPVAGGYIGSALGMLAGGMIGYSVVPTLYKMAQQMQKWGSPETGGMFLDNMQTMTMRQRSMLAIRTSQLNYRNELGREAQILMGAQF